MPLSCQKRQMLLTLKKYHLASALIQRHPQNSAILGPLREHNTNPRDARTIFTYLSKCIGQAFSNTSVLFNESWKMCNCILKNSFYGLELPCYEKVCLTIDFAGRRSRITKKNPQTKNVVGSRYPIEPSS